MDSLLSNFINLATGRMKASELVRFSTQYRDHIEVHGIAPMLYLHLESLDSTSEIPDETTQWLQQEYVYNSMRNISLYEELSGVLEELNKRDINFIVLKGAALAEMIYHDTALRPMGDVDLLIHTDDILKIHRVMVQLGYESNLRLSSLISKRHIRWHMQRIEHVIYTGGALKIEVHPRIHEIPGFDPWTDAVSTTIGDSDAYVLNAENLLLHLCVHLDVHISENKLTRLNWWYDIPMVLKHYGEDFDWDRFLELARKYQVEGAVRRVLYPINKWFDGLIAAKVPDQLKDEGIAIPIEEILERSLDSKPKEGKLKIEKEENQITYMAQSLRHFPSLGGKLYHIFRALFPSKEFMICRYSIERPRYASLYYPVRFSRIIAELAKLLFYYLNPKKRQKL